MKRLIVLAMVIFLGGSVALAQTTEPSAPPVRVLIVPFRQIGDMNSHTWVGAALQENMIADTAAIPGLHAVSGNQPLANVDSPDALKAARDSNSAIVVFGSYQLSADQLRVNGQAMDSSGHVLATLQVTGAITDLFKIEDTLGSQLDAALPQPPSNLAQVTYGASTAAPQDDANTAVPANAAPSQTVPYYAAQPAYSYPQTTYVYPDAGYYGYGYPYYYPYVPFYFGFGGGWGWHGGGWRGGGWHGGGGFHGGFHGGGGHR